MSSLLFCAARLFAEANGKRVFGKYTLGLGSRGGERLILAGIVGSAGAAVREAG
jgi:hypothetical protein